MKNKLLKILILLCFLIIPIPGNITMPNGLTIFANLFSILSSPFVDKYNFDLFYYVITNLFLITCVCFSIVLLFSQQSKKNAIALFIQITWLIILYNKNDIKNVFYLSSIIIYISLCIFLIYANYKNISIKKL